MHSLGRFCAQASAHCGGDLAKAFWFNADDHDDRVASLEALGNIADLVSVFQRRSTSWGDQMGSALNNAILAFLESDRGGTLADLRRFLIEPNFRADFLKTVRDPNNLYY